VSGLLILLAVAGLKGSRDLEAARERRGNLERRIQETRHRNQELKRRIELLEGDPATLERLAREELGMVRPSDVVILLPEEP
jgi:cell division protein FtsB